MVYNHFSKKTNTEKLTTPVNYSYVTIYSRERWIFSRSLLSALMHFQIIVKAWFQKDFNLSTRESCLEPKVTCECKLSKLTQAELKGYQKGEVMFWARKQSPEQVKNNLTVYWI